MGKFYYHTAAQDHLRNFNKTLGFALFFERHERHLRVWQICKKLKITERELDDIELGPGIHISKHNLSSGTFNCPL